MATAKPSTDTQAEIEHGGIAFVLTSPVRPDQLDHELVKAAKWRKPADLVIEGDPEAASEEQPVLVYVRHENADEDLLLQVLGAHTPDPEWREDKADLAPVKDLIARLHAGADLSKAETSAVLRHLLQKA